MFNKLEYLTYNTIGIYMIIVWIGVLMLLILSTSLLITKVQIGSIEVEIVLTALCMIVVWLIISPSLIYILDLDLIIIPSIIIHALGVQWFWNFHSEFFGFKVILDQIITSLGSLDLASSIHSYLSFFNSSFLIPSCSLFKFLIYSFDVIHSFGIYALGIKYDAIPGRFHFSNALRSFVVGSFKGFCYELCGRSHSSMLIEVRVL